VNWSRELNVFYTKLGYTRCASDSCLYYKVVDDKLIISSCNVDDIIKTSNQQAFLDELRAALSDQYSVKQFDPVHTLLGIHITQMPDGVITMDIPAKLQSLFETHPKLKELHTAQVPMSKSLNYTERELTDVE